MSRRRVQYARLKGKKSERVARHSEPAPNLNFSKVVRPRENIAAKNDGSWFDLEMVTTSSPQSMLHSADLRQLSMAAAATLTRS